MDEDEKIEFNKEYELKYKKVKVKKKKDESLLLQSGKS